MMTINNLKKSDRTRIRLQNAFMELLSEKSFFDITIDDIAKRADTYRSTFYRHYSSKEELLRELEDEVLDQLFYKLPVFQDTTWDNATINYLEIKEYSIDFLTYIKQKRDLCYLIFIQQTDSVFNNKLNQFLYNRLSSAFDNSSFRDQIDKELFITMFSGGIISVLSEWLSKKDDDAEKIVDFFLKTSTSLFFT